MKLLKSKYCIDTEPVNLKDINFTIPKVPECPETYIRISEHIDTEGLNHPLVIVPFTKDYWQRTIWNDRVRVDW